MNPQPSSKRRVLVVEDDPSIALGLKMNLGAEGYDVLLADDGESALERARDGVDLIILDVMLPRVNGFEVVRTLRQRGDDVPVILLSAKSSELDKVMGLELGAEDYVTKPFSLAELLARVRVALRRRTVPAIERHRFGEVTLDVSTREVARGDAPLELTVKEFDVLLALIRARGRVLTREQIVEIVWGPNHHGTPRTVDNFVAQLRQKVEADPSEPRHIVTVRGIGYRFVDVA